MSFLRDMKNHIAVKKDKSQQKAWAEQSMSYVMI